MDLIHKYTIYRISLEPDPVLFIGFGVTMAISLKSKLIFNGDINLTGSLIGST